MVLGWKRMECSLWVGDELLPQEKAFKYLRVLLGSEGRMKQNLDRIDRNCQIGVESAVMCALLWSVVVKRDPS